LSSVSSEDKFMAFTGAGYVVGVVDSFNNDLFCIPAGVTKGELVAVVLKFLNNHPDTWYEAAVEDVGTAPVVAMRSQTSLLKRFTRDVRSGSSLQAARRYS